MQAAGAAERHEGELARIVAAIDGHQPDAVRHVCIGDPMDTECRFPDADAERAGYGFLNDLVRKIGL